MPVLPLLVLSLILGGCEDSRSAREAGRFVGNTLRLAVLLPPLPGDEPEPRRFDPPAGNLEEPDDTVPGGPSLLVS
jgi:hypothetical protein